MTKVVIHTGKTSGDEKLKGKGDKSAGKMPASHDQGTDTMVKEEDEIEEKEKDG